MLSRIDNKDLNLRWITLMHFVSGRNFSNHMTVTKVGSTCSTIDTEGKRCKVRARVAVMKFCVKVRHSLLVSQSWCRPLSPDVGIAK